MQVEKSFDICLGLVASEGWRGRFGTVQMEKACETPPALFWPGSARSLDGVRRHEPALVVRFCELDRQGRPKVDEAGSTN